MSIPLSTIQGLSKHKAFEIRVFKMSSERHTNMTNVLSSMDSLLGTMGSDLLSNHLKIFQIEVVILVKTRQLFSSM